MFKNSFIQHKDSLLANRGEYDGSSHGIPFRTVCLNCRYVWGDHYGLYPNSGPYPNLLCPTRRVGFREKYPRYEFTLGEYEFAFFASLRNNKEEDSEIWT